ncbi:T9SS type A sorting domain-containing protein [Ekhidna sp. To15]|uniref:T9SS type A sorting domain-containing protein n=1 Tax=Ekhidna sp. To15 TaxID=3395267 RepID=UPI003F51B32D
MRKISCLTTLLFLFTLTYSGLAQTITIDSSIEGDDIVNAAEAGTVTISGTSGSGAVNGTIVRVTIGGVTEDATITGADGPWMVDLDISGEANGPFTVAAVYDPLGTPVAATNNNYAITLDQGSPTATVTVDSDPIFPGDLTQVVTVTYDEPMNPATNPAITFSSSANFTSAADGAWSGGNTIWTETFNHDGTSEQSFTETADVASTSGATDVAGNADIGDSSPAFVLDTQAPTATVTVDSDPIFQSDLTQVVTVTYDEPMNPATNPAITFSSSVNFTSAADGAWSVGNTVWTETFNHDGTAEEIGSETADVASASGATDVVGIADVGDSSPGFVIDTQSPTATVTVDSDPIFQSDLAQVVTVTYDEPMNPATNPAITFSSSANFTSAADGVWSGGNTIWTETFNHDGTAEEIGSETADVASTSGATDAAGNVDIGDSSPGFVVDTQSPTATVTVDSDPIFPGDLVQVVTVTYDEPMNPATNPAITFSSSANFTSAADGAWSGGNTIWTETFNHDGTSEQSFTETADVASTSGATDVAGNADIGDSSPAFVLDTQAPTATVTVDSDPIFQSDLTQVVTVTYDEPMNPATNPAITFSSSVNFTSAADGAWSVGNTVWTETFNHDGTAEEIGSETADVASASGATDVVGIADVGDSSPGFVIDTQSPTATVTVDSDPIFQSDLAQVVTVTYDEPMNPATNPAITFSSSANFTSAADGVWSGGNTIWTETFNHDGTAEEIGSETADVASTSGATDAAGNVDIGDSSPGFVVDTQSPTATVTVDSDPIFPGDLVQVVTVTYDEPMNPATNPAITFSSSANFTSAADGAWSGGNTIWTETFNHDGTSEQSFTETADVASTSGATDVAGNADIGDSSPAFVLDTQAPTATVTVDSDPIFQSDLTQVVTVTYDEPMNPATNPAITFSSSVNFTSAADGAWSVGNTVWTETFNHDGTAEEIGSETADVASASGATDVVGIADVGDSSPGFVIDTQSPTFVDATFYDTDNNGSIDEILVEFSEDVDEGTVSDIDFNIAGTGLGSTAFTVFSAGFPAGNGVDASLTDNYITLLVTITGTTDQTIAYTAGSLADEAGNLALSNGGLTTIDLAPPVIISAVTADIGGTSGEVDQITVTFSEDIDGATLDTDGGSDDFIVTDGAYTYTVASVAANGTNGADITLTERGSPDTGVTPDINLGIADIEDLAPSNNALTAAQDFTTTQDGAPPVMYDFTLQPTNSFLEVVFSETIQRVGGGTPLLADFNENQANVTPTTTITINSLTDAAGTVLASPEDTIQFTLTVGPVPSAYDVGDNVVIDTDGTTIEDAAGNPLVDGEFVGPVQVNDVNNVVTIVDAIWVTTSSPEGYIELEFSDGVYGSATNKSIRLANSANGIYEQANWTDGTALCDDNDDLCATYNANGSLVFVNSDGNNDIELRAGNNGSGGATDEDKEIRFSTANASNIIDYDGTKHRFYVNDIDNGPWTGEETYTFGPANASSGKINGRSTASTMIGSYTFVFTLPDQVAEDFDNATATAYDVDNDGNIDEVEVVMPDGIEDATVTLSEFQFNSIVPSGFDTGTTPNDDTFRLLFDSYSGTAVLGNLVYTAGTLEDDAEVNASYLPSGNAVDGGTITPVDAAGPVILSALTADNDLNGQIDEITVTFSEAFADLGIDDTDFSLSGGYTIPGAGFSVASPDVTLTVDESGSGDTYITPDVTVSASILQDLSAGSADNPAQTFTNTSDGAAPFSDVDVLATTDASPDLSGNIDDPNATVLVNVSTFTRAATNNGDGTWSFSNTGSAPGGFTLGALGNYEVTVIGVDPFGNTSTDITNNELTINGGATINPTNDGGSPLTMCTSDGYQPLGQIQIVETGNGDFSSSGTINLTLPDGFEFNTGATVTSTGSSLVDISVAFSYVGSVTLRLTITYDGVDDGLDDLRINGLEVQATSGGQSGDLERNGGTANLLTTGTNFSSFVSEIEPSTISSLDEAVYTTNDVASLTIRSGLNFTLDATDQAPTTVNWYENVFDGTPEHTGVTANQAQLNSAEGLYTYFVANNDGTCDSPPLEFELLLFSDDDPTTGPVDSTFVDQIFIVTDDTDTIYLSNPAGHTVNVSGAGTTVTNPGDSPNPLLVIFDPAIAGDDGAGGPQAHTITYDITNNATGASTSRIVTFTVEPETEIFTGPPAKEYCYDGSTLTLTWDNTGFNAPNTFTNPYIQYVDVIAMRYNGINFNLDGPTVQAGGYSGSATPYEYDLDLNLLGIPDGDFENIRFARVIIDAFGVKRTDAFNYFLVYGEPFVTLTNVSAAYCEDDTPFTINRTTSYVESVDDNNPDNPIPTYNGETNQPIVNGYELYRWNGASYVLYEDFTSTGPYGIVNDFDPSDPNQNSTVDANDVGQFRITYYTEALTPNSCIGRYDIVVNVNADTPAPTLDAATLAGGGAIGFVDNVANEPGVVEDNEYLLEYCVGDIAANFVTGDLNTVRWYDENRNLLGGLTGLTSVTPAQVGLSTVSGRWTEQSDIFYFTSTDANGCESDYRLVSVEVYPIPDAPNTDLSAWPSEVVSGSNIFLDYSLPRASSVNPATLAFDPISAGDETYNASVYFGGIIGSNLYFLTVTGGSGTFIQGEVVTGGTSGATGTVHYRSGSLIAIRDVTGTFINEGITGSVSGATTTVTNYATRRVLSNEFLSTLPIDHIGYIYSSAVIPVPFTIGETITGGTSGATAVVYRNYSSNYIFIRFTSTTQFEVGEVVTGGSSGSTLTVTQLFDNFNPNYRYTVSQTSNINLTSNFAGCEGSAVNIYIYGQLAPTNADTVDFNDLTDEYHVAEGDALANITHTASQGMDNYIWYEDVTRTDTIAVLVNGGSMTQDILDDAKVDGTKQLTTSGGLVTDRNDDGVNDVYTYYLTRVDNAIASRGFDGSQSATPLPVTLTVHAIQLQPSVASDNSTGSLGTPDFPDLDASANNFYSICTDQLESDIRLVATEATNAATPREFRWYVSNASFDTRGSLLATDGSGIATFSELGLAGLNPATTINRYFEVIQVTDIDVFGGVESESTFVRIDISPQDALTVVDDLDTEISDSYCRDDDPIGDMSGDLNIALRAGVTLSDTSNVDFEIDSYLESTYIAIGTPEVDRGVELDSLPTVNLIALHDAVAGTMAVGGEPTVHVVTMSYTDPTTLCTGVVQKVITIYPDPHISFEVNGIDVNDPALVDEFCYEDGNVALQGVQYIYDNTGIIDTVNLITGQFTSDLTGNLGSNVGQGTFNPTAEHNAAHGVTGTDAKYLNRTAGSDVSLSYTDGFGCERTVSQVLFINPEPEVLEVTGLPTSDLAQSNATNYIRITDFCEGSAAVTAEIKIIDPADPDPSSIEEDDYSGYIFTWTVGGSSVTDLNTDGLDNTIEFVPASTTLNISVVVTDLNGCSETFTEVHVLQNLPELDITGIEDFFTSGSTALSSYCADDTDPIVGLTDATVDGDVATNTVSVGDVVSWSVDSYSDDDLTPVQIASGTGSLPTVDLDAWHTDVTLNAPGSLVGGPSTYHQITIVYQDPSREYQGIATTCTNTVIETIVVHPDPDISITLDGLDIDDLQFCYDDINIALQGLDLGSGLALNGGAQNIIRIDGAQVSSNGQAVFNAATYHGTNPGDEFLPQSQHTIEYVYEDANGCVNTITRDFFVNPRPRFTGDAIQTASTCATSSVELFVDMTDGVSNYTFTWFVNGQEVNGVDVIDEDGNDNDERITYDFGGQLTANFGVTATYIGAGFSTSCVASIQNQSITVGAEPIPAISWVGITAGNTNGTDFTITEDNPTLPDGDVDLVELEIDGNVELSVPNPTFPLNFNYSFAASGDHTINLTMNTTAGCDVTLTRTVRVLPHYTGFNASNGYSESFETAASFDLTGTQGGWLIDSLSLDGKNYYDTASSWTRGSSIPGTAASIDGSGAVYTAPGGSNGYQESEVSFVYSPSFDLSEFTAPTVSFLRYEDFETFRDGVVFQVSTNDGRTWQTVGTYNAALEDEGLASTPGWYNREAISSAPGSVAPGSATASNNAQVGWALNSDWQEAISPIEIDPAESAYVRFRFALSAQAGAKTTNGFGFDFVRLYERNQVVLLELFSSTWSAPSLVVNDSVNSRPQYAGSDILKINYFTDLANNGTNLDQINQKNTTGPGAKVAFYGVGNVPNLSIAGDANYVDINGNTYSLLNAKLANARLNNPAFDIVIDASVDADGNLVVDADFTATTSFSARDKIALHVAVVEPIVTLTSPMGLYAAGASVQNVMRKLLPSAAGQYEPGPIAVGGTRSLETITWPINNMFDPSNIRVIAYAQDLNTKQIYQAASFDLATGLTNNVLGLEDLVDFKVYPNPADKEVMIEFANGLQEDTEWVIFDQAGREVLKGELDKGTAILTVQTSEIPSGMYFIHLYGEDQKQRVKRVMIVH